VAKASLVDLQKIYTSLILASILGLAGIAFNLYMRVHDNTIELELLDRTCYVGCDMLELEKLKLLRIIDKHSVMCTRN